MNNVGFTRVVVFGVAMLGLTDCMSTALGQEVVDQKKCKVVIEDLDAEKKDKITIVDEEGKKTRARVKKVKGDKVYAKLFRGCKKDWVGAIVEAGQSDRGSSAYNRKKISYDLGLELAGFAIAPIGSYGMYGSYYLTDTDVIELSHATGTLNLLIFAVEANLSEVRYKKFWGNSFYTNLSLGRRTIGSSSPLADSLTGESSSWSAESITAGAAIGNKWQWENFHLGTDWIGFNVPLSTKAHSPFASDDNSDEAQEARRGMNELGKVTSTQLLRFYLGFSW